MSSVERKTVYFHNCGEENTHTLLKLVRAYARSEGIRDIVVASSRGYTGVKASKMFKGLNVVVVTHHAGFLGPGQNELEEENRKRILENGARILTATHTLRLFGEGTKVCVEIALMAADAGLISENKEIIAIAGTGRGADTALVIKPACSARFFDLEVREIIAKPRNVPKD